MAIGDVRRAAARQFDLARAQAARAATLARLENPEHEELLERADTEIAKRRARSNLELAKELRAEGLPVPAALLRAIRRDIASAEGRPAAGRIERAARLD